MFETMLRTKQQLAAEDVRIRIIKDTMSTD